MVKGCGRLSVPQDWVLDNRSAIQKVDPDGMTSLVERVPDHWRDAERIARAADLSCLRAPQSVVVLGMGGSAIGGDLVRALLEPNADVPILVNRDYVVPAHVGAETLVVASSYSGNTEETLEALDAARARGAQVAAVTSGGQLEALAGEHGWPLIKIPGGMSPRAALAYSFVPLLVLMEQAGVSSPVTGALAEAAEVLERQRERFGPDVAAEKNPAKQLALSLKGKLPLIYGSRGWKGTVAYRWKCQINENAKAPAVWNVFPELNHNETVGWESPREVTNQMELVLLRDQRDDRRTQARIETTREIMEESISGVTELWAEGESDVARLFSLIYPGDWVSLYLALLYGNDPTPIQMIDLLKSRLAAVES